MCGRFGQTASGEELAEFFDLQEVPEAIRSLNIAPSDLATVIHCEGSERVASAMLWGLEPAWSDQGRMTHRYINARLETAHSKVAFRGAFAARRCLVPSDGFYEWRRAGRARLPHHIGLSEGRLFAMAGLWERGHGSDAAMGRHTFSVMTTSANQLVRQVHDRMPVLVPQHLWAQWLRPGPPVDSLIHGLGPYPEDEMVLWPVGCEVNRPGPVGPQARRRLEQLGLGF